MKLTIERAALLRSLGHVQSVVERRTTIPILSNMLLEAAEGRLNLTATDLDLAVVESVAADVAAVHRSNQAGFQAGAVGLEPFSFSGPLITSSWRRMNFETKDFETSRWLDG